MTTHGTYVDGKGWYDATINGYVERPDRLTKTLHSTAGQPRPFQAVEWREDDHSTPEASRQVQAAKLQADQAGAWRPDPRMEELRQLRANNPAAFDRIARGSNRIALGSYEAGLRAHVAQGGQVPKGVARPGDVVSEGQS
ncbi:hypothetical protein N864_16540 [Intrasporangium chromatireducens Q5-1]|uniref:Uncharacterized protein n=1 Tax=Intrasporangium chromatireducens Q5-1 TaxID=584657 RepID=W9GCV8_9MICO|nr:hypothetical protein [Intrasporangium chromatireducens]EWT04021.1 hypothetical protein N864_16540 [Intrasporangium chromatireducens Q5-1]